MEAMTTDDKLLAQDDIDALLGEAGIEGNYETDETSTIKTPQEPKERPVIRFAKRSEDEVKSMIYFLRNKALLEREDNIKVIWNAAGTIPMASGFNINIQDMEYVSLGVLRENHLVVKDKGNL